jgi:ketosteroid isomerase-like protein
MAVKNPSVSEPARFVEKSTPEPIVSKPRAQAKMEISVPKEASQRAAVPMTMASGTQFPYDLMKERPHPDPPAPKPELRAIVGKPASRQDLQPVAGPAIQIPNDLVAQIPNESLAKLPSAPAPQLPEDSPSKTLFPEPAPPSTLAKEEEVKRFFTNFIEVYNGKDLEAFLAFFSPKAVQNQKDGMEGIRKVYGKFFGQSEKLHYRLAGDARIDSFADRVEVRGRYHIDQTLKGGGEKKVWIGNASWVLIRESGVLKVLLIEYKHQK